MTPMPRITKREFNYLMGTFTPRIHFQGGEEITEILYEFWDQKLVGNITDAEGNETPISSSPVIVAVVTEVLGFQPDIAYNLHYIRRHVHESMNTYFKHVDSTVDFEGETFADIEM